MYMLVVAKTNYFQIHNLTLDICLLSKRGITLVPLQLPGHFSVLVGYLSHNIYPISQNFLSILILSPLAPHISNHNTRGGTLLIVSRLQLKVLSHSKKSDGNVINLKHGVCVISITQSFFLNDPQNYIMSLLLSIRLDREVSGYFAISHRKPPPPPPPGPQHAPPV